MVRARSGPLWLDVDYFYFFDTIILVGQVGDGFIDGLAKLSSQPESAAASPGPGRRGQKSNLVELNFKSWTLTTARPLTAEISRSMTASPLAARRWRPIQNRDVSAWRCSGELFCGEMGQFDDDAGLGDLRELFRLGGLTVFVQVNTGDGALGQAEEAQQFLLDGGSIFDHGRCGLIGLAVDAAA